MDKNRFLCYTVIDTPRREWRCIVQSMQRQVSFHIAPGPQIPLLRLTRRGLSKDSADAATVLRWTVRKSEKAELSKKEKKQDE